MEMQSTESPPRLAARLVAFHLPQFHPIPENDEWWGKGFTEWTNVARSVPLFRGHYQPHLPSDLGFYDLRLPEARKAQADLARAYGIEAFCYWHYWFHGQRLLERPVNEILASGEPDFPFCLAWANELWSRRWLGEEKEILINQTYSEADDLAHARWLAEAFADPRYLRVDGRPMFLIYKPKTLPDARRTTETIRSECVRLGVPEPYLVGIDAAQSRLRHENTRLRHDRAPRAAARSLTRGLCRRRHRGKLKRNIRRFIPSATLKIYDYAQAVHWMTYSRPRHPNFPCCFVGWDNTARRGKNAIVMTGGTPEAFRKVLSDVVRPVLEKPYQHRIVFINAWNEWAEGMHLEPDQKYGLGMLEAVASVLEEVQALSVSIAVTSS